MPGPDQTSPDRRPLRRLGSKLLAARAALFWERLWPALLPPALLLGLFLTLALLDLLPLLGPWLHLATLLAFAGGFAWLLRRALRGLRLPDAQAARRRLERDSGLAHRPLTALEDLPAGSGGDPLLAAYWRLHRARLLTQLRALRVGWPRAGWARSDGLGLRALVGLPLLVAVVVAAADWQPRLLRAAVPELVLAVEVPPTRVDVWISPPAYTGEPPAYLDPAAEPGDIVRVPAGSRVLAQVQGGRGTPRLDLDGDPVTDFRDRDDAVFRAETELVAGRRLSIDQGGLPIASWSLAVIPDLPPTVEYLSAPARAARGALQFEYEVADDYGVESLTALIERRDEGGAGEVMELPLPLPARSPRHAEGRSFQDLTPHLWAGIPVTITLEVRDALGQGGRTESFETSLPERVFNHPVARRLAELRRELTLDPERRRPVATALDALARQPQHYFGDIVVSLGILTAEQRLLRDRREEAVTQVQNLLWDLALRIEEGDLSIAERRLRELQQELQQALAADAPQEEIERLMNELQEALDQFLQAMAEQALRDFDSLPMEEMPALDELLSSDQLQDLIEQAREMARAGAREQARELLAELQRMLENLQAQPLPLEEMNQRLQQTQQMMRDLQEMMREQQDLLDRSFQRAQRGEVGRGAGEEGEEQGREASPGRAPGTESGDALAQESLRRELGDLMRRSGDMTGNIPRPFGQAEQAMRAARDALERGASGEALGPQGEALDHLQRGMETMLEDLAQQFADGEGGEGSSFGRPGSQPRDPFGRQRGEGGYADLGDGTEIPEGAVLQRAREILDELRRRSGQRSRPQIELDYLDRLLRQF